MADDAAEVVTKDFQAFSGLAIPIKRAAYSDRTAWLMAIMAQLAYTPFDEDSDNAVLSMAAELAELAEKDAIAEKLKTLLKTIDRRENTDNAILRNVLKEGGFILKGVLFSAETDTQGFVAVKKPADDDPGMAVVAFRGTQEIKDWITNLDSATVDVTSRQSSSNAVLGKVHKGFDKAFKSVESQINDLLEGDENLPLYISGHSLGGALATLATWYLPGTKLAACYTFGAPRAGDTGLRNRYRTPIYRIVNGADPVPFVPPSGITIDIFKFLLRLLSTFLPILDRVLPFIIARQGYRHYGDSRYLTICVPGPEQAYPALTVNAGVSTLERIWRVVRRSVEGAWTQGARLDKYHSMGTYRAKLRSWAQRRQKREF